MTAVCAGAMVAVAAAAAIIGPVHIVPCYSTPLADSAQRRKEQRYGATRCPSRSRYVNGRRRGVQPRTRLTRARRHVPRPQLGATSTTGRRGYEPIQHEHARYGESSAMDMSPEAQLVAVISAAGGRLVSRVLADSGSAAVGGLGGRGGPGRTGYRAGIPPTGRSSFASAETTARRKTKMSTRQY